MMRVFKSWGVVLLALAAQASAIAGEVAVLRNGNSIPFERREETGDITRLYTSVAGGSYVEIPTGSIASFEKEAQEVPPPQPETPNPASSPMAVQAAATPPTSTKDDLDTVVREASGRYHLDPDFVRSVIKAESNFQPGAVSPKGAQGLMQLMPGTAAGLGVKNPFDPKSNVEGGTAYLSQLFDLYHNDSLKALAAYNAGAFRVQQYHGVPPFNETRAYIARIVRDFNARKLAQMKLGKTANAPASSTATDAQSQAFFHRPAVQSGQAQSGTVKAGKSRASGARHPSEPVTAPRAAVSAPRAAVSAPRAAVSAPHTNVAQ